MSDPVTHAEIEDVLSSIRRLVSEDGHSPESGHSPGAAPKPANRLVLTPALRVHQAPDEGIGGTARGAAAAAQGLQLNGAPAHGAAFDPETPQTPEEQTAPAAAQTLNGLPGEGLAQEAGTEPAEAGAQVGPDAPWSQPGATLFGAATAAPVAEEAPVAAGARAASVVQKIAELEARIAQSPEQWEPDGAARDPFPGAASLNGRLGWGDEPEAADLSAGFAQDAQGQAEGRPATACDGASGGGVRDTSAAESDLVETALTGAALDRLGPDAAYHDEDSLRELVASIVREELQGALGERITRNVRKLVRREIHRSLASQDLL